MIIVNCQKLIRHLNAAPHADIKAIDGSLNTSLLRLGSAKDYAFTLYSLSF